MIVAPGRARRPSAPRPELQRAAELEYDPDCPFCPGNEKETPPEAYRLPGDDDGGTPWQVRVFPNKFPALVPRAGAVTHPGHFHQSEPATGCHEVIVETTSHARRLTGFSDEEMLAVLRAYRARFAAAAADPLIKHVVIFRNQGNLANASLPHPHSQLAGLAFVPDVTARVLERSREHRGAGGHALLFDIVQEEIESESRLIDVDRHFASFVPFAPNHEFEVWVAPRFVPPRFDRVDDDTLLEFGRALRQALSRLESRLDDPDYNYVLHTPPLHENAESDLPWYVQIIPRLTVMAGFELGIGVQIAITAPEEAAARLRGD